MEKNWSCGLPENHPDCQNPEKYSGKNLTGEILMKVRDNLMQSSDYIEEIKKLNMHNTIGELYLTIN